MKRTRRLYQTWWCAHYVIGLLGMIAGTLLTASSSDHTLLPDFLQDNVWLVGIVAAVATSLVTFLGPLHKAERYWSAYHHLEQACLEFKGHDADPRTTRLMRRVMQVRRLLQVVDENDRMDAFPKTEKEKGEI